MRARGVPIPQKISVHLGAGLGSKMHTVVLNQNGAKETANNGTLPEIASPKFGVHLGAGLGSEMSNHQKTRQRRGASQGKVVAELSGEEGAIAPLANGNACESVC